MKLMVLDCRIRECKRFRSAIGKREELKLMRSSIRGNATGFRGNWKREL